MCAFDYVKPETLEEAGEFLLRDGAYILAGGTDLILALKSGARSAKLVVDIKSLRGFREIHFDAGAGLKLGATVTIRDLLASNDIRRHYPLLTDVCDRIGSFQIRNRATIGGNLCLAASDSDLSPVLLCYDAVCHIWGPDGERDLRLEDFFLGDGQTALGRQEMLMNVQLPAPVGEVANFYHKLQRGQGDPKTIVGAAVQGRLDDHTIVDWRIALAACAPTPIRIHAAEAILNNQVPTQALIQEAVECTVSQVAPEDDLRASAEYRRAMAGVLVRRGLRSVVAQLLRGVR